MREVLRSNDPVLLSFAQHVLDSAGIGHLLLDGHMSALEGSIGAIPRRLAVADGDYLAAMRTLGNASITNSV